jgi:hypothetical protein
MFPFIQYHNHKMLGSIPGGVVGLGGVNVECH